MNSIKYQQYTAEEFANDKDFWLWVLNEDAEQVTFWATFSRQHPEKAKEIEAAKDMVMQLNAQKHHLEQKKVELLWEKIKQSKEALDGAVSLSSPQNSVASTGLK